MIEGRFATVVVRVTQIEPGISKTLDDVKAEVRDKLAIREGPGRIAEKA